MGLGKSPIENSFRVWLAGNPESFHPLDKERFYIFVKCVCRYSRKEKNGDWLRIKIENSGKILTREVVDSYCEKFKELRDFYNTGTYLGE